MDGKSHPIPGFLNICIACVQLACLLGLIYLASTAHSWLSLAFLALGYGVIMNSAYAMLHESEHNMFHPNPFVNKAFGVILALFFPAPFHLIRQGHIGHHMRNRSDDEAFDFYFEGENVVWRYLQLYGILTGFFWVVIALGNVLAIAAPGTLVPRYGKFDRPTEALLASLNPRYRRYIQAEAALALALHGTLAYIWRVPLLNYAILLLTFGVIWSAMQYVHHFGTVRDVAKGARNLKTFRIIDVLWLNHNYHLNHHLSPTVPWIYLPSLYHGEEFGRGSLLLAYLRMWRGPSFTKEKVENRYAGKIVS